MTAHILIPSPCDEAGRGTQAAKPLSLAALVVITGGITPRQLGSLRQTFVVAWSLDAGEKKTRLPGWMDHKSHARHWQDDIHSAMRVPWRTASSRRQLRIVMRNVGRDSTCRVGT